MPDDRSDRVYPHRPLVGVGAVVWDGHCVLLARRGKPPAQGAWSLPGGLVELGETVEDAVGREVREECGIEVAVGELLGVFEPIIRGPDERIQYHYVVLDYLAHYRAGELQVGDDAAEARWVAPSDLTDYDLAEATTAMIQLALTHLGRQSS